MLCLAKVAIASVTLRVLPDLEEVDHSMIMLSSIKPLNTII